MGHNHSIVIENFTWTIISFKPFDSTKEGCISCMKVSNYKEVFFKISKVLWTIKPQMNSDWNGKNGLLFFTRTSTGPAEHFHIKCGTNLCVRRNNFLPSLIKILWSYLTFKQQSSRIYRSAGTPVLLLSTLVYSEVALECLQSSKSGNFVA